ICEIRITARISRNPGDVHRNKESIHTHKCEEEMNSSKSFIQHPSEHPWKPIEHSCEDAENGSYAHNEMEMSHHKIGVMEVEIEHRLPKKYTAQATRDKHRNKS